MPRTSITAIALSVLIATIAPAQWVDYPTRGIPKTADGKPDFNALAPKNPDGKPDLSGIWMAEDQKYFMNLANGLAEGAVNPLPWARALQQHREDTLHGEDPLARCLPQGVPRINTNSMYPFK